MLETCCTSWTLQKGRQGVNSYSRNPNRALSKTNEPHEDQACYSYKQVLFFPDAGDMLHQLDPPKGSTRSEFVLQKPNGALSKTNEPHGAQACHSCKQVFLFLIAGNMLHLLDPPKTDQHRVNSYSKNQMGLFQRQMSPMGHKPARDKTGTFVL